MRASGASLFGADLIEVYLLCTQMVVIGRLSGQPDAGECSPGVRLYAVLASF